ncbi:DUF2284 domain-containing protein [Pectinatus sottacetonis]|uniref:DUF2284 domain-containing protein n=1 Tax=Pectinatus sottacetonis TaxID=1002795 RepID=UPI0018C4FE78|nr:DUF2284 domain-containing protein [Pectinatus sottacetonis]
MENLKITIKAGLLQTILAKYQHKEKFLAYCKTCSKYENRWSCPPLSFSPNDYLQPYTYIYFIGIQLFYDKQTIAAADTSEKITAVSLAATKKIKKQVSTILLAAEKHFPETLSLSSGGCDFCCRCTRPQNEPCRKPEKMRYSLDSFGIDLSAITKKFLNISLLWNSQKLPAYHTLVHGLLTKKTINEIELQNMFAQYK